MASGATAIHGMNGIVYLAAKLRSYSGAVSGTGYGFRYDANGRALSATAGGGTGTVAQSYTQAYSFSDPAWPAGATVGNLERVTDGSSVVNHDYMQDRLVSTSSSAGATLTTNLHDHAGRLTSKRTGGVESEGFVYDLQDQLRQIRRGGAVTEKLEYDPTGAPLYRMVGNQAIYYVGPFATVTATVNAGCTGYACAQGVTGVQVSAHVLLGGSRIASVRASSVLYYHRDQRGSVVATTLSGGQVGALYRYGPYGQLDRSWGEVATTSSELGFTGGLRLGWSPSTGTQTGSLLLLGARVYDAALRRWLQADLVDEKRYTYTDGDPVNYVDPSGRMRVELFPSGLFDGGGGGGGTGFSSGFGGIDRSGTEQRYWGTCTDDTGKEVTCWYEQEQVVPGPAAGDRPAADLYREMYQASMSVPRERARPEGAGRLGRAVKAVQGNQTQLITAASLVWIGYEMIHLTLHVLAHAPVFAATPWGATVAAVAITVGVAFMVGGVVYGAITINSMLEEGASPGSSTAQLPRRRKTRPRKRRARSKAARAEPGAIAEAAGVPT